MVDTNKNRTTYDLLKEVSNIKSRLSALERLPRLTSSGIDEGGVDVRGGSIRIEDGNIQILDQESDMKWQFGANTPAELREYGIGVALIAYINDKLTGIETGYFYIGLSNQANAGGDDKVLTSGQVVYPTPGDRESATFSDVKGGWELIMPPTQATVFKDFNIFGFPPVNMTLQGGRFESFGNTVNETYASAELGDAFHRCMIHTDGLIEWGPGDTDRDLNLYRKGLGLLATDNVAQQCAVAKRDALQTITTGGATDVSFDQQVFDNAAMFAPTSATITIPTLGDGLYRLSAWCLWESPGASPAGFRRLAISKNNGTTNGSDSWHVLQTAAASADCGQSITVDVPLVATDTVRIKVWHTQGVDLDIQKAALTVQRMFGN